MTHYLQVHTLWYINVGNVKCDFIIQSNENKWLFPVHTPYEYY